MPAEAIDLVTARKFPDTQIWTPLGYAEALPQACRTCRHIHVVGRVKQGTSVEQRQREIGLRVALGATTGEISRLVLRLGLTPTMLGVMAGEVMSVALARAIESMLYGTSPLDRATYAVVIGVMVVSALGACVLPARRAAAVNPAATLKSE